MQGRRLCPLLPRRQCPLWPCLPLTALLRRKKRRRRGRRRKRSQNSIGMQTNLASNHHIVCKSRSGILFRGGGTRVSLVGRVLISDSPSARGGSQLFSKEKIAYHNSALPPMYIDSAHLILMMIFYVSTYRTCRHQEESLHGRRESTRCNSSCKSAWNVLGNSTTASGVPGNICVYHRFVNLETVLYMFPYCVKSNHKTVTHRKARYFL